jgi:hypothetical protein
VPLPNLEQFKTRPRPNPAPEQSPTNGHNFLVGTPLQFQQSGQFLTWREGREIAHGTELLAIMPSLRTGWLRWEGRKCVDHRMGRVVDGFKAPRRNELPAIEAWVSTNYLVFVDTNSGEIFTFTTSSDGGRSALGALALTYSETDQSELPVVALGARSYRGHGKTIYVPIFEVTDWR